MPLPSPKPELYSEDDCTICHKRLLIPNNDADPLELSWAIDDAQLCCGHRFHQSCILEYASSSPDARKRCPLCGANVLDKSGRYTVNTVTENGYASSMDLGKEIDEQA